MFRPVSLLLLCSASLALTACPSQPPAAPAPTGAPAPVASTADAGVMEVADAAPSSEAGPNGVVIQPGGPDRTGCPCADADMCNPGQLCVCTDGLDTDGKPTPANVPVKNGQPGIGRCQFVTRLDISVCILHNGVLQLPGAQSMTHAQLQKDAPPEAAPGTQCPLKAPR